MQRLSKRKGLHLCRCLHGPVRVCHAVHAGRPVINKTGLDGKYDFHLKFTPADAPASADTSANADAAPNLFT
ncbi:DUF3738 domain-containing protein, partial [Terriglobus sp. ADX1]|uniref:DUF3738 domain-containing protein n=1 Tax=Terriglobus sp. ADX1 TaxID=2794063 RepID=UPI003AC23A29